MKKLLISALALTFLLTATGCTRNNDDDSSGSSTNTEETANPNLVCKYSGDISGFATESSETYENNGTKITKIISETTYTSDDYSAEDFQSMKEYMEAEYQGYEGIDFTTELLENGLKYTFKIDLSIASNEDLIAIEFLDSSSADATYIDLELTKEGLEGDGYTCAYDE